jgi:hypothetical protein
MTVRSTDNAWLGAQIPRSYHAALFARAEREDRSASSVVRSALAAFLFGEAELRAPAKALGAPTRRAEEHRDV